MVSIMSVPDINAEEVQDIIDYVPAKGPSINVNIFIMYKPYTF